MDSRYYLRFFFALFPAYVTCLGTYEVIVPEVKQMGSWSDPAYSSVHLPHRQGTHGSYNSHKGRLVAGSNIKSDPKDCQTQTKSDNQENMINFKPSASVPKYDLSGFGQPSAQYESRTAINAIKNVQPSSQLASMSSPGGSTSRRTLKVPQPNPLKPSRDDSSCIKTSGSSSIFVVKPPKKEFVLQHSSSKGSQSNNEVQTASSSYGPLLKGIPVNSNANPRRPSNTGLKYTEGKSSVVSSGPVFVVQSGGSAQRHGGYSGHPDSVKPLRVPNHVDSYQASQISRDIRLTASSQGKSWNEPLHYSKSGTQSSPELRKPSQNDCRDNVDKSLITSSETLLNAPGSAHRNTLPGNEVTHPKFQRTYYIPGPPSQNYKPMYPSRSGAQRDVTKSLVASSGAILIMQDPTSVRTESNKPKVHPSFPERRVTFASGQTDAQPFEVTKNSITVRPATSTYSSSSWTGYRTFSPNKPNSRPSEPSNKINTVRVRLNKPLTSSFGNFQNQWAPGYISNDAFQSSLPPSYLGQKPGQNAQMPVSSSAPQYFSSEGVQSQFTVSQGNADYNRRITAIPSGFGQGAIRRLFPTLSSNYRQANQPQVNRMGSSAPKCEVTQNSPAGPGQQDLVKFQELNLSV